MTTTPPTQQQLESYLWGAATLLRGFIDAGDREVKQTLFKYKLHQEEALFDRAYEYIRRYY